MGMECPNCENNVQPTKYGACPCCREHLTDPAPDTCHGCHKGFNADHSNLRFIGNERHYFCDNCLPIGFGVYLYRVRIRDPAEGNVLISDELSSDENWVEHAEGEEGVEVTIITP